MNRVIKTGLMAAAVMLMMNGCNNSVPGMASKTKFNECPSINKKLIEVDNYIMKVENTSAFHLEETGVALQNPQISTSNNKKDMLKDANRKRDRLMAESQKYQCEPHKKR